MGLVFLGLVWIFGLSGLLLNHSGWPVNRFWPSRQTTRFEQSITRPENQSGLAASQELMAQLGLAGEPDNIRLRADGDSLTFNVVRPGKIVQMKADLLSGVAAVETNRTNLVGVVFLLHAFTGVRAQQPENTRDWWLTGLWSLVMDLLCASLVLTVVSGLVISFRRGEDMPLRLAFFGLGILACLFFIFGLQWIY